MRALGFILIFMVMTIIWWVYMERADLFDPVAKLLLTVFFILSITYQLIRIYNHR